MSDFICHNCGKKNYGDYCSRCGAKRRTLTNIQARSAELRPEDRHVYYDNYSPDFGYPSSSSDCSSSTDSSGSCGSTD